MVSREVLGRKIRCVFLLTTMINGDLCQQEYQQLLQSLKGTVEGLLISHVSNVWNIYGGLNRLHKAMEKIFKHGCRVFNHDGEPDCLVFIQGLNWLQPSLAVSPTSLIETDLPQHVEMNDKALVWLYKRQVIEKIMGRDLRPIWRGEAERSLLVAADLEGHTLSQKLSWLLSDREHLLSCFEKYAFLCQEHYGEATLICLRAVEQNQPSLLTEINPCLYLSTWKYKAFQKTHRRCSSFPDAQYNSWRATRLKRETLIRQPLDDAHLFFPVDKCPEQQFEESIALKSSNKHIQQEIVLTCDIIEPQCKVQDTQSVQLSVPSENNNTAMNMRLKAWTSLPNLVHCDNSNDNKEIDLPMPMKTLQREGSVVSMKTLLPSSRTVPSSPAKFLQPVGTKSELLYTELPPVISKLSPSILQVDYSSELVAESISEQKKYGGRRLDEAKRTSVGKYTSKTCVKKLKYQVDTNLKAHVSKKLNNIALEPNICSSDSIGLKNITGTKPCENSSEPNISKPINVCDVSKPCVRPSELKLSSTTWDEKDEGGSLPRYESDSNLMHKKKKTVVVGSAPEYAREWLLDGTVFGHKERHFAQKKSFIDSGGSTVLPMATGFFPRPAQGQSLTSFLSSGDFSRPSAELDRENAHFSISEAMIAAIEQVKCNRQLHLAEEVAEAGDESDEEINHLKQRIRLRRHQRQEEKQRHVWGITLLSDGRTDSMYLVMFLDGHPMIPLRQACPNCSLAEGCIPTTTDQSVSPLSTSPGTPSDSISTDDVDDLEVDEVNNLAQLKNSGWAVDDGEIKVRISVGLNEVKNLCLSKGLSVSMASLYSEADLSKHHTPRCVKDVGITDSIVSAEGVALCLIRQFSEKHLPRASDLQWLVSEQDAPQQ
ncbi:unnamed protein product, partial [Timema podura]|nr:unnamed protein product [Timema podura]